MFILTLVAHTPRGIFEGAVTATPLQKSEAEQLRTTIEQRISEVSSLVIAPQGSQAEIVLPGDVLKQSVLTFTIQPEPLPPTF